MPEKKNPAAVKLGKMAAGKPKPFSKAERTRRRQRMIALNKRRVAGNSADRRRALMAAKRASTNNWRAE